MNFSKYQNIKALSELDNNKWKLFNFGDVLINETSKAVKIKKKDYLDYGEFPIIDQGKEYIAGYSSLKNEAYEDSPVIIFGDHTRVMKYIDFPIFIGADGVKLLKNRFSEDEVLTKYLYYYLCTVNIPDTGYNRHFKYLKEIVFPIPNIDIQKKIVETLEKAEELIEKRKNQIEILDQLIQSIFLEMFGDVVNNPNNWEINKLNDVYEIIDGDRGKNYPKQDEFFDDEYCLFLNTGNVTRNGFSFNKTMFITKEKDEMLRKGKLQRFDLVLTTRGTVGNVAYYDEKVPYENIRINSGMVILRKKREMNPLFFVYYFRNPTVYKALISGTAQPQMPISNLRNAKIYCPPLEIQNKFGDIALQIYKKKEKMKESLNILEENFNSLKQHAFKGKLFTD